MTNDNVDRLTLRELAVRLRKSYSTLYNITCLNWTNPPKTTTRMPLYFRNGRDIYAYLEDVELFESNLCPGVGLLENPRRHACDCHRKQRSPK